MSRRLIARSAWVVSRFGVITLGLAAALACGEYPGVPRQLGSEPGSGDPGLPPARRSDAGTSSAGASNQVVSGRAVQIELKDFELVPSELTVPAGEITFTLVNGGRYTHDFRVEGGGIDGKAPRVSAGRTGEWGIALSPGVYRISCPISNHDERGMVGTLTVIST